MNDKTIFVTGGAGFIGSNLCESLVQQSIGVVCYDNLTTGLESNIEHLKTNEYFKFIKGDICDLDTLTKAMNGCDIVLQQAALGSVPRSIHDPITTNKVNIDGFLNVMEAAKANGIKRVVYASSSSVYGDSMISPKVEDMIGKQLSPYAVSKRANELYAGVFNSVYGLEVIGLRYFNVFGRKQRPDGAYAAAIPKFIHAFLQGRSPEVYGDGEQTRDFTYIDNVIEANILAATTDNSEAFGSIFNVACGDSVTVNEVIAGIKESLSSRFPEIKKIQTDYKEPRIGDVRASLADISKAKSQLGYTGRFDFKTGLNLAIEWYVNSFEL